MSDRYDKEGPHPEKVEVNKQLVLRALTDPEFREVLAAAPEKALGKETDDRTRREIGLVLDAVRGIEAQISALADQLLCANGDPCGIAIA